MEKEEFEKRILYVLQRFARFAREAGYDELGIAFFQALIELNFFRPETLPPTSESIREVELDRFEEFWDSECPRFGEEGAKGWKSFDRDGPFSDVLPVAEIELSEPSVKEWHDREERSRGNMPARTTDNVNEGDPYRVILFNDIRPFLYSFTTDVVQRLPYAFLSFFGINLPHPDASSNELEMTDPWLHNSFDTARFWPPPFKADMIEWINGEAVEPERMPGIDGPFGFNRKVWPIDIAMLFPEKGSWFELLEHEDFSQIHQPFLSTALNQLKPMIQDENFMIYHLTIDSFISPSTVLKLAKSYLRTRKTSISLWNVYAQLLWYHSDYNGARKVWNNAIDMAFATHVDPVTLWATRIESEFNLDLTLARESFAQFSAERLNFERGNILGGAGEMKTRKYIQDNFDRTLSFKQWDFLQHYAFLGILLEYLSSSIDGAIAKYHQYLEGLRSKGDEALGSVAHERLLLSVSKILFHHTRKQGWYRLSTLRDFWAGAIDKFSHNTAFLSLFTWNEASVRIDGRVRKLLASLEKTATVDTWLFAVWAEITVKRGRVSESSLREIFEKAS
jgi:hypothetical protein